MSRTFSTDRHEPLRRPVVEEQEIGPDQGAECDGVNETSTVRAVFSGHGFAVVRRGVGPRQEFVDTAVGMRASKFVRPEGIVSPC